MTLPYGCMTDEEMKAMPLASLQEDGGLLFLWVTGRAVSRFSWSDSCAAPCAATHEFTLLD